MSDQNLNRLQRVGPLPQRVADELREAILRGRVQPGEHLREATVAAQLGVSTVPVREAFHLLEREGLIDTLPRRGKFVHSYSEREIGDLYRVRASLDELAYAMINEQGGLSAEALQLLQQDIDEVGAANESNDLYLSAELDLRFHDHIHAETGSEVLQGVWQMLRTRLHLLYHWRLIIQPEVVAGDAVKNHTAVLNGLRKRD